MIELAVAVVRDPLVGFVVAAPVLVPDSPVVNGVVVEQPVISWITPSKYVALVLRFSVMVVIPLGMFFLYHQTVDAFPLIERTILVHPVVLSMLSDTDVLSALEVHSINTNAIRLPADGETVIANGAELINPFQAFATVILPPAAATLMLDIGAMNPLMLDWFHC
jgi:hypothetical protein